MGRNARIDVKLRGNRSLLESLDALLRAGWGFEPNHVISYLPLGDDGMFEWQDARAAEWPAIRAMFEQKVSNGARGRRRHRFGRMSRL